MVLGQLDMHVFKNYFNFIPLTRINSRWIVDRNIKGKTIELLKDNTEECFHDYEAGKSFLTEQRKHQPQIKRVMNWTTRGSESCSLKSKEK